MSLRADFSPPLSHPRKSAFIRGQKHSALTPAKPDLLPKSEDPRIINRKYRTNEHPHSGPKPAAHTPAKPDTKAPPPATPTRKGANDTDVASTQIEAVCYAHRKGLDPRNHQLETARQNEIHQATRRASFSLRADFSPPLSHPRESASQTRSSHAASGRLTRTQSARTPGKCRASATIADLSALSNTSRISGAPVSRPGNAIQFSPSHTSPGPYFAL